MTNSKTIGERIRILRITAKLTQKDLGQKAGLSGQSIRSIEHGNVSTKLTNLTTIAAALNCELEINFKPK
jgi:transcriptional regulator with XRE-family HTH domain